MASQGAWFGIGLLIISSVAYSTAGFFTRLVSVDVWTLLFWRGLFGGIAIACFIALDQGRGAVRSVRAIGRPGLAVALLSTTATISFISALRTGEVADVMVIAATLPIVTAGIAWVWLGEREHWQTLVAALVALGGIAIMCGSNFAQRDLLPDVLAFAMPLALGAMMVIIRRHRQTSMLPAVALSAFLCALVAVPFADLKAARGIELFHLMLFGILQFGLGLVTLTLGSRLVSSTRAALIANIETPLGIAWVWAAFGEQPGTATVVGAVLVVATVTFDVWARKAEAVGSGQAVGL